MWLLTQQMLASVVAVVAVVGRYCYKIDYWRLMMTVGVVGVAVVAVVGVVAVAAVLLQDWMMTVVNLFIGVSRGVMVSASDFGSRDRRFESRRGSSASKSPKSCRCAD